MGIVTDRHVSVGAKQSSPRSSVYMGHQMSHARQEYEVVDD